MEEGSIKLQYFDDYGNPTWEVEFDSWQVIFDEYNRQVRISLAGVDINQLARVSPKLNIPKQA